MQDSKVTSDDSPNWKGYGVDSAVQAVTVKTDYGPPYSFRYFPGDMPSINLKALEK